MKNQRETQTCNQKCTEQHGGARASVPDFEKFLGYQSFRDSKKAPLSKNINAFLRFAEETLQWNIPFTNMDYGNAREIGAGITVEKGDPLAYKKIGSTQNWGLFVKQEQIFSAVIKGSMNRSLRYTHRFVWKDDQQTSLLDWS